MDGDPTYDGPNPLREEHLQCLNGVLESCPLSAKLAAACKACGYPVDQLADANAQQLRQAAAVKRTFFKDRP